MDFQGFNHRFGSVFCKFFGAKCHAGSETKKSVWQAKNIVKTNTKLMSALVPRSIFQTQIHEKSHAFWNIDLGRFLKGFWKGFWRRTLFIFAIFSMLFRSKIRKRVSDSQRIAKSVSLGGGLAPTRQQVKAKGKSPSYLRAGPLPVVNPMRPLGLQRIGSTGFLQTWRLGLKTKFCAREWPKDSPNRHQTFPNGIQDWSKLNS